MTISTFSHEKKLLDEGYDFVIGVDEAGRGPLAGPVVAAATLVRNFQLPITNFQTNSNDQSPNSKLWELVRDSKTLSEKQREKTFDFIHEHFYVGLGICDHKTIDRINILEATFLAMKKSLTDLITKIQETRCKQIPSTNNQISKPMIHGSKFIILVDGNKTIPNFSSGQRAIINGDKLVKSIAAASIVAKVTRDRLMLAMHEKYPIYGFDKHKGYGTKLHMDVIRDHGPSEIHRMSFEPLCSLAKKEK